jgi:type IV pilus assembly protein PilA
MHVSNTTPSPARHTSAAADRDHGFTLVEILISIVLVGILSAVVVVGIGNLTSKGSSSACLASLDAAKAAAVVHYTSGNNTYPATMTAMTTSNPPSLTLPTGVTLNGTGLVATGSGWTLTMTPGTGGLPPTFACS